MHEIELKYQVPAGQAAAVDRAVAGRGAARRMRLEAAYYDTDEHLLAAAGLALRVRREGRRWVQTLKGPAEDGMTRIELNVARGAGASMPAVDPALHADDPTGRRLQVLLAGAPAHALRVQYRTDILRRSRVVRTAHGRVELSYDTGRIEAGSAHVDVAELEFELHAGTPRAVLDVARRWSTRFDLWLDARTKAERGDALARGQRTAPPRGAQAVALSPTMDVAAVWQAVLRSCADQILANASPIAGDEAAPEHVHQLRVGLRRLRSALRLFDPWIAEPALAPAAARLFAELGEARDRAVLAGPVAAEMRAALLDAGLAPPASSEPGTGPLGDSPVDADPSVAPGAVVRAAGTQQFLLDLLTALQHDLMDGGDARTWRRHLDRQLRRWHRQVVDDARRYAQLDDTERHTLRKRAKRLRYASEFGAALYEPRAVRRYLRALRAVQERLGTVSDVVMAGAEIGRDPGADPTTWFALGWLTARRVHLIEAAVAPLHDFAEVRGFWK